jgi:6-phosphogluconolactonase
LLPDFDDSNYLEEYYKKVKRIDIWLLWVWPDGHTCSLFPNHELLENNSYKYLEILDSPKPPSKRITISKSMLQDIYETYVFFIWEWKRKAYIDFLNKQIEYYKCPIKLIENNKKIYLFSDLV